MELIPALLAALDRERRAVMAEHEELRALPLAARRALGFSAFPLTLESTELRSRRRVNVLLRGADLTDAFAPGDPVVLGPVGQPDVGLAGRIEGLDESTVELRVEDVPVGPGPWCISRRLDFTIWEENRAAVARAGDKPGPLANLLLGHERPYRADPYEHPAFARLNPSQRAAAELVLGATEVGLLHGPPGTGKTETLCAILVAARDLGERPWALAESNAAVDHLALRAAAAGLEVVRLGVSARIGTAVQPLSLEWRILHGPRAEVIRGLMRQAQRASGVEGLELRDAIRDEWAAAKREVLEAADVIAMTLGTLATRGRGLPAPRTAVVDEASQIMEPALWPLVGRVKRLLLAGDPMQLGAVVKSRDPVLERSLLQRLVEAGFVFPMLTEEYRFNTELLSLSAETYGGRLTAHPSVAEPPVSPAATWVDTAGMGYDEERESTGSFHNPGELALLVKLWGELREAGVAAGEVAVVTPYRAQLLRIRAALPELESGTVNAFQGREKRVVLASFVRSNPEQELGFVADPRRLNVTITRARERLVLVGDSATLAAHPAFAKLFDRVNGLGGYRSGWELAE
jgi:superfamily I DNA and/or RNA helicase